MLGFPVLSVGGSSGAADFPVNGHGKYLPAPTDNSAPAGMFGNMSSSTCSLVLFFCKR